MQRRYQWQHRRAGILPATQARRLPYGGMLFPGNLLICNNISVKSTKVLLYTERKFREIHCLQSIWLFLKNMFKNFALELHYSILIQWSNEDKKYVVSLPEFGPYAHTHGDTYEDALKNAEEVLELLIETYQEQGKPLPQPKTLEYAS